MCVNVSNENRIIVVLFSVRWDNMTIPLKEGLRTSYSRHSATGRFQDMHQISRLSDNMSYSGGAG